VHAPQDPSDPAVKVSAQSTESTAQPASRPKGGEGLTYESAGVSIDAGNEAVRRIKALVGTTRRPEQIDDIGGFAGIFFGIPGLVAGPFLGASLGEVAHGRPWRDASRIGLGTWLGLLIGAILKLMLALAMLVLFALAIWVW